MYHHIFRLWLKTVNALRERDKGRSIYSNTTSYTSEEIERDPLIVLRCDRRVYRCPPLFDLLVRVLNAYLAASRALLNHHLLSNPLAAGMCPVMCSVILSQNTRSVMFTNFLLPFSHLNHDVLIL